MSVLGSRSQSMMCGCRRALGQNGDAGGSKAGQMSSGTTTTQVEGVPKGTRRATRGRTGHEETASRASSTRTANKSQGDPSSVSPRPGYERTETAELLSYYSSPLADDPSLGGGRRQTTRTLSGDSQATSESDYTPESTPASSDSEYSVTDDIPQSRLAFKRTAQPSQGGSDRRRLHIVDDSKQNSDQLALVAPPDVKQPNSFATQSSNRNSREHSDALVPPMAEKPTYTRTSTGQSSQSMPKTPEIGQEKEISVPVAAPVIVSLSPQTLSTPHVVSPPTVSSSSAFLNYQPGIHSTAGPLPEPPKASFAINPLTSTPPPPRPPRLHSPQPRAGSPAKPMTSVSSTSKLPITELRADSPASTSTHDSSLHDAVHTREGAFPPSRFLSSKSSSSATSVPPPLLEEDVRTSSPAPSRVSSSARTSLDSHAHSFHTPSNSDANAALPDEQVMTPTTNRDSTSTPPSSRHSLDDVSPAKLQSELGQGLPSTLQQTLDAKRLSSLPRTPSLSSSMAIPPTPPTRNVSLAIHPPIMEEDVRPPRPAFRYKSRNPPAMSCDDIPKRKSPLERCSLYARKINELYMYDCGLADWIAETRYRRDGWANTKSTMVPPVSVGVAQQALIPHNQNRRTSVMTQATASTFPQRPDASKATDLTGLSRPEADELPPSTPPVLPYPSLATATPRSTTSTLPSLNTFGSSSPGVSSKPLGPKTAGSFFSSLGRKTSVRKDRPVNLTSAGASSSGNKLMKNPPPTKPNGNNANLQPLIGPSVPGGPRAPPQVASSNSSGSKRSQRSQTLLLSPTSSSPSNSSSEGKSKRTSILGRRPSLISPPKQHFKNGGGGDYDDQVAKLADLLPHADRNILGNYLRRTGEPMLAIGQYLEDERTGNLKRD
ncbi:hypothetical protein DL96DRAFT_1813678 [Flagelloscypha sp. PMI_526]|nr:hypothetical protein DL96DRAFT_1813678 [Flagelloscypha sp. PMI_526]